jgi:hypothetical protein
MLIDREVMVNTFIDLYPDPFTGAERCDELFAELVLEK